MTEAEWLASDFAGAMLDFVCRRQRLTRHAKGRRRLRLFACACCRRAWDQLVDGRSRHAVEVAERYADGTASKAELDRVLDRGRDGRRVRFSSVCARVSHAVVLAPDEAMDARACAAAAEQTGRFEAARREEWDAQAALARDIFGNPFRPVAPDPAWLTSTVVALAAGVYDERAFDRLPILADALQDAGCEDAAVLDHCRGPGPHARGCWVVDMLLGKS